MHISPDTGRVHTDHETLFWAYRWVAWVLAGFALVLPGEPLLRLPSDSGLWGLLGLLTIGATAFAPAYLRMVQQQPIILALDMLIGFSFVWLSGGRILPFMPYALGTLILPGLLWGWRAALGGAACFIMVDLAGLHMLGHLEGQSGFDFTLRAAVPFAFALIWPLLEQRSTPTSDHYPDEHDAALYTTPAFLHVPMTQIPPLAPLTAPEPPLSNLPLPRPAHPHADDEPTRRMGIFTTTVGEHSTFPTAIEQLVLGANQRTDLDLQLTTLGQVRPLTHAQQSVMLRVAQEALLNIQHHARAQHATLTLDYDPLSFTLMVQDDGVGLLDGTYERPGMHALRALRYRLAEMDGELMVAEQSSGGVVLQARIPLA